MLVIGSSWDGLAARNWRVFCGDGALEGGRRANPAGRR
jgi:hypothetical protein